MPGCGWPGSNRGLDPPKAPPAPPRTIPRSICLLAPAGDPDSSNASELMDLYGIRDANSEVLNIGNSNFLSAQP